MLVVTIGPERALDEPDELGRIRTGYREGMSDRALYEAARGSWVLGDKADNELFALVAHGGLVRMAIEIERLVETAPGRRAIEGRILHSGDEVYDQYMGSPSRSNRTATRSATSTLPWAPGRAAAVAAPRSP